jgi:type IV pilus assembly protein PilY1
MNTIPFKSFISMQGWIYGLLLGLLVSPHVFAVLNVAQVPLFLTQAAKPIVMLNISNDHQLYFKAFDDYSDLDGDGVPETTYKHSFDYYGYFDSYKCYDYSTSNNRFEPATVTGDKYCTSKWSGNFLNWATMARIDTIRKILYGGFRSSDSASLTVLERTYLPNDAHSFAKFYSGSDLNKLIPFSSPDTDNGVTICNTTVNNSNALSQNVTDNPLVRVAKGNFSLWASNERWQCRWSGEKSNGNGNNSTLSGITASSSSPTKSTHGLGEDDYVARIKVCDSSLLGKEECKVYDDGTTQSYKPIGLLQTYGDEDKIRFGLMTGSYKKNKSGGVLRKNVGSMTDEINVSTDGTFKSAPSAGGIINTLNKFRMFGYRHQDGTFHSATNSDDCIWGINSFTNGKCTNWGNPQSEILLESLRYLAGQNVSSTFNTDDTSKITGLTTASFTDPIPSDQWCAPLNVIQFNASTSSYDGDELSAITDLGATGMDALTDAVGVGEGIPGKSFFVGENGTDNNQLCTAKTVTDLSDVRGTCPDAPRLSGSYQMAGIAHYAHSNSIRSDRTGDQLVTTYGVALSPAVPKVVIPVPGGSGKSITLLPACKNTSVGGNCAIVDFKIVSQTDDGTTAKGKLYVNWEDSEQGGDFDQDMWGVIDYSITSTLVTIKTDVIAESTPYAMGFGYIINGTSQDGFHAHSGINNFNHIDPGTVIGCVNCNTGDAVTTYVYSVASTTASSLEQPLYYAAKWGGFVDSNSNDKPDLAAEWDANGDGKPDRYFVATDPKQLATSLGAALSDILLTSGSSASVATNSTRLDTNTVIYQAKFNSADWTGQFLSFTINSNGTIAATPSWDAGAIVTSQGLANRSVFSYNSTSKSGITFNHTNLSTSQQGLLTANQVEYLKGDQSNEQPSGTLRKRTGNNKFLGDIINSDPWFIGKTNFGYYLLPPTSGDSTEPDSYLTYRASAGYLARKPMLAIGANDGMAHVFDATIGATDSGKEIFAYVPDSIMANLPALTSPTYTSSGQHKYYVDGSPVASDVYIDVDADTDKEWRTVLIETTGAGGKGLFALDVSFIDPAFDDYSTTETAFTSNRVLWEINTTLAPTATDLTDDTTGNAAGHRFGFANHLGLTMGQPSIVRMANGKYAAVFGNGYNSANHVAVLYIVDIQTGQLIKSISTQTGSAGSPNGLSTPITVDVNGDRVIDVIYAGDLLGNLWKFDVSDDSDTDKWVIAFKAGSTPKPLYVAKDASNVTQPITAKPQVGAHPNGGVMVYFGTGKYFETGDNVVGGSPQVQTFYGLWDECVAAAGTTTSCSTSSSVNSRSDLIAQTIDAEGTVGSFDVRQTSANNVDYTSKKGWYMDLLTPPQPGTANGERVVSFPLLRSGRIIFVTLIPDNASCSFGGTSWLMELDALSGKRLNQSPFDLNGDNQINDSDNITIFDTNNDSVIDSGDTVGASGKKSTVGIIKTPGVIGAGTVEYKYASGSTGALEGTTESVPGTSGRQSWLQLR